MQELINQSQSRQTYDFLNQDCPDQTQPTDNLGRLEADCRSVHPSWSFGGSCQPFLEPWHDRDDSKNFQDLSSMPNIVNDVSLMTSARVSSCVFPKHEWIDTHRPGTSADNFMWHRHAAASEAIAQNHETSCNHDIVTTNYQNLIGQPSGYIPSEAAWLADNMIPTTGPPEVLVPHFSSPSMACSCQNMSASPEFGPESGNLEDYSTVMPNCLAIKSEEPLREFRLSRPGTVVQMTPDISVPENRRPQSQIKHETELEVCYSSCDKKSPSEIAHQQTRGQRINSSRSLPSKINKFNEIPRDERLESQWITRRSAKDDFLVQKKQSGMTYKDIKREGGYTEAESTLRGRFRALTKAKSARVRKPEWTDNDVRSVI